MTAKAAHLRVGRFEFFDGRETQTKNPTIGWLQTNRISDRLIGNFGFSTAQRSFDGLDAHYGSGAWNITAMAARADQGVFNMNGNPELNVDLQYLALTRSEWKQHVLWRAFAIGYHDGRTGLTKTDNRALAVRSADHQNIRIGTYGGDLLAAVPSGPGQFDFLFWGALQNGSWGELGHSANAAAVEGGYQLTKAPTAPWLRGGWFRSSGDNNATDGTHNTFFQILPTPRVYARLPFYNLMNSTDEFVSSWISPPSGSRSAPTCTGCSLPRLMICGIWVEALTTIRSSDTGPSSQRRLRSGIGSRHQRRLAGDKERGAQFLLRLCPGEDRGCGNLPTNRNTQYGYVEFVYRWGLGQKGTTTK